MREAERASLEKWRQQVRSSCLSLPETTEGVAFDDPVFRVAGRVFAGVGRVIPHGPALRLPVGADRQQALLQDRRFFPTPYLFHKGWVSLKLEQATDMQEVEELIQNVYRQVAPARLRREQEQPQPGE